MRVPRLPVAALLGAAACYGVLAMTEPPGPGLDPDSMSYLGAAQSLVRHGTLRIPMSSWSDGDSTSPLTHFPPGLSAAIALPLALGMPLDQAGRLVIAASALVTVGLAAWLVAGVAGAGAGALAGVLLLVSPSFAFDHWQVLSEPLCLALIVVTLYLMTWSRRPWTYGTTAALAALVRYAALSFVGAAALWALGRAGPWRQRLRGALVAAAPGAVLFGWWSVRSGGVGEGTGALRWQPGMGRALGELGGTLRDWLAPSLPAGWRAVSLAVALVVGGAVVRMLLGAARRARDAAGEEAAPAARLVAAAALLAACYAAEVIVSRLVVYDSIPFDARLLSPFIALVELATAAALGGAWPAWRPRARAAAGTVVAIWLALSAIATSNAVRDALDGGWGYAGDDWNGSRLGEWLRTHGARGPIFSNNPAGVWFLAQRPSREVPGDLAADSVGELGAVLRREAGLLVRFPFDYDVFEHGTGIASPDSLARRLGLPLLASFPLGAVWGPPGPAPNR